MNLILVLMASIACAIIMDQINIRKAKRTLTFIISFLISASIYALLAFLAYNGGLVHGDCNLFVASAIGIGIGIGNSVMVPSLHTWICNEYLCS